MKKLKKSAVALCTLLALLFLPKIVQSQSRIDSIQYIGATVDSLEYIVYSSIDMEVFEYAIKYKEELDNIKVTILYSASWAMPNCFCPIETTIKIKKDIYQKAIISIVGRYPIGGPLDNPEYSDDYWLYDSKEIDLPYIVNIVDVFYDSCKVTIFPNPVQNVFYVELEEYKTVDLEIYNIQGSLLLSKNVATKMEVDISFLSSGVYFVLVDKKYIYKIIKE